MALLQLALISAGKDQKILSGGLEAKPPGSAAEGGTDSSILVGKSVRRFTGRNELNESYLGLLERQARRGLGLLPDHAGHVERKQQDLERRRVLATAFGDWIANSLGPWDWFVNPITFRDRHPDLERDPETREPRNYCATRRAGPVTVYVPDPRLKSWIPIAVAAAILDLPFQTKLSPKLRISYRSYRKRQKNQSAG